MHALHSLFRPKSLAIIGASRTPGKLGYDVLQNVTQFGYTGNVYPVNPKAETISGLACYPSVSALPEVVDVAVIMVPAPAVISVLKECGEAGVPFAVVISAGFKETGAPGAKMERGLREIAQEYGVRLVGPNCLGFMNAHVKLNASFASGMPDRGNISLLSQSGAMGVAMLDWAYQSQLGFANILSVGNKADINEVDCIEYFGADPKTDVIMMYLESMERGEEFMEAAAAVSMKKPIVVLKAGVSEEAKKAVQSHTGSLAGSDAAMQAAFDRVGIIRARTVQEFFDYGLALSLQPKPAGDKIAIITNAGGPGIMAVDACDGTAISLPRLRTAVQKQLAASLPQAASTKNPVDVLGDAPAERYEHALDAVLGSSDIDGAIVILTPQSMTDEDATAAIVARAAEKYRKPILASFMGGMDVNSGRVILEIHHIPNYETPERAVKAMNQLVLHAQKAISPLPKKSQKKKTLPDAEGHIQIRTIEAENILTEYNIPVVHSQQIATVQDCKKITNFPVVMKAASREVVHKSASGALVLNIESVKDAQHAFTQIDRQLKKQNIHECEGMLVQPQLASTESTVEVIIGMKRDPSFGPLIMFGMGGSLVELFHDVAFAPAPLTQTEALQLIQQIHSAPLLSGMDTRVIARTIAAVSRMAIDYPEMSECDINPLIVRPEGSGGDVVDVRIMVQ